MDKLLDDIMAEFANNLIYSADQPKARLRANISKLLHESVELQNLYASKSTEALDYAV